MPVHDWSRVGAGVFHDFHQGWVVAIRESLNGGALPPDYYALVEQSAGGPIPDVLALERVRFDADDRMIPPGRGQGTVAVAEHPPQVSHRVTVEAPDPYVRKASRVAVYHASGDKVVAYIEIVSPGNKHSERAMNAFVLKVRRAMERGLHLLLVDLHHPTPRDPQGLHAKIWEDWYGDCPTPGATSERPYSLVAYCVDESPTAYYEPVGLLQVLPDMPVFLTPDDYVNVPLEATYLAAWRGVPERWRTIVAGAATT